MAKFTIPFVWILVWEQRTYTTPPSTLSPPFHLRAWQLAVLKKVFIGGPTTG